MTESLPSALETITLFINYTLIQNTDKKLTSSNKTWVHYPKKYFGMTIQMVNLRVYETFLIYMYIFVFQVQQAILIF